ncbi:MAG: pentapeptide repeat-containing protein [Vicingaceae bacterium]
MSSLLFLIFTRQRKIKTVLILLGLSTILSVLFHFYYFDKTKELKAAKIELIKEKAELQGEKYEALKSSHLKLVSSFLEDMFTEDSLASKDIKRLSDLSKHLEPQNVTISQQDSLVQQKLSPGRGQLLKGILLLDLDTMTLSKIFDAVSFKYADLRGADLRKSYLKGINLSRCNLSEAKLSGADISQANVSKSILINAQFINSNLSNSALTYSNLSWSNLDSVDLKHAKIDGAILNYINLSHARCQQASLRWASLRSSIIIAANFKAVDLFGSTISYSNLKHTSLKYSRLRKADFLGTSLKNISLDSVVVDKDWIKELKGLNHPDIEWLKDNFIIVKKTHEFFPKDKFFLKPN